jgi:class 3 adenylate cyclase
VALLPLRLWLYRRVDASLAVPDASIQQVLRLPWRAFLTDMATWLAAGLVMVFIYYTFLLPYASTAIKVLAACAAFGMFSGMMSYLSTERRIVHSFRDRRTFSMPSGRLLTVSKKILVLIVTVVGMMAFAILLMVLLDVYYLIGKENSRPEVYWGIFKEIAFALCILLGISLVIVKRYAANLKAILDLQLNAMDEISRGNLEKQVPIVSSDEFARVAQKTNQMMLGLKERDFCRSSFDKYVSPEISRKILDDAIAPSGEILDVSVLFADLRNYTGFAEQRSPADVVAMMNRYFSEMERVIRDNGGVVLQFIGDEIEAVFGAPKADADHPDHAVAAAVAMRESLQRLNAERRQQGEPEIQHGIGVHSGPVLAGNVGSAERKTYTMLGDTVNLASRLQVLNKQLETEILISGATRSRLVRSDVPLRSMGRHSIKGKTETVDVYAVEQTRGNETG